MDRKEASIFGTKRPIALLVVGAIILLSSATIPVHAPGPFGEIYSLSQSATRIQETNSQGITFILNVTHAFSGVNYQFTWTVRDPSGTVLSHNTQVNSVPTTFTTSAAYPTDFGATITQVGNYNVTVTQTSPPPATQAATSLFEVGLTNVETYQRTQVVAMVAQGYQNAENITISISSKTGSASGFPTTRLANSQGVLSYSWTTMAPSVPLGNYTVTLTGSSTPKTGHPDTEVFLVRPANMTITQLSITQSSLQRSQVENFRFVATYPSNAPARTGSAMIRIIESDGVTEHDITATYRTTLAQFAGTYQLPLSSSIGVWVASIDVGNYNDGYGNIGPSPSVNRGFAVSAAVLAVMPSIPNGNYTTGSIIVINAIIVTPGGDNFTSGTVTAIAYHSSVQIGSPLRLSYDQSHGKWVGSYTVNATSPTGTWFIQVNATDLYGNSGYGSTSTLVTLPPSPTSSAFNYLWIVVIALVAALTILASFIVYRRGRVVRSVLKIDLEAIHAEAAKVENNEFFKNVQEQLKEQRNNPQDGFDAK
ncbi:MAG TPA: hypothetical protein VNA15_10655 [Candidatus Angelobacter sp.]|nr:hypothetical protein [Candidatus Angelobacter sp.]